MATRSIVAAGGALAGAVAVLALLGAYAIGSGSGGAAPASAAESTSSGTRTIAMTGTGEAVGVPDQLTFQLAVHKKADDVAAALADANATTRRVLAALAEAGVLRKDVQTTGLSIRPDYDYSSNGPPVLTGYVVSESASVLVRDLGQAGKALSAAAGAGGNAVRVHGVGLRIGDREDLMARARDAAVAAAQAKADQYAESTGQSLGPVVSLKEVRATPRPSYELQGAVSGTFDARVSKVPIRAGSEDLKVTVSIVWQLD